VCIRVWRLGRAASLACSVNWRCVSTVLSSVDCHQLLTDALLAVASPGTETGSSLLAHSRLSRLPRPPFGALPLPAHKRPTIQLEECVGRLLASSVSCDIIRIKIRVAVPPSHYSCFTNEDSCRSTDFQKTMWPVLHRRTTTIVVNSQNSCRLHKCESPGKNKCIDT